MFEQDTFGEGSAAAAAAAQTEAEAEAEAVLHASRRPSRAVFSELRASQRLPSVTFPPEQLQFDSKNLSRYNLHIKDVIETTLRTMKFTKKKEDGPGVPLGDRGSRSTSAPGQRAVPRVLQLLFEHVDFLEAVIPPLFWLVHLTHIRSGSVEELKSLQVSVARKWHKLVYPLRTGGFDQREVDKFLLCIPYFFTQAIQDAYIRLVGGHESVMKSTFRMKICGTIVKLFSGLQPIDSLLRSRLSFYFHFPPQADLPDVGVKKTEEDIERVTLPMEDPSTLIEMCRRERAVDISLEVTGVSVVYGSLRRRATIPYTRKATMIVQQPKNGVSDWTTDLPPLLPPMTPSREITVSSYRPSDETRSLMQRSRRPLIFKDHGEERRQYKANERERQEKRCSALAAKKKSMREARECGPGILSKFVERLRGLQLENKRTETPDIEAIAAEGASAKASDGPIKVQLEIHQQVVGLLEEGDLHELDDLEEERAYVRAIEADHPVCLTDDGKEASVGVRKRRSV
jgi:hypothetical protein